MKRLISVGLLLSMSLPAVGSSPFEKSVEQMLSEFNQTKDVKLVGNVLIRCASLLTITNAIKGAPEAIQIDPNKLFVSSLKLREENPDSDDVSRTLEEFREYSKQYQTWFKNTSEDSNPFETKELKKEFQICDESARQFLDQ
jgi:hypothetical protein